MAEALRLCRADVISAAESKLGRQLSGLERDAVERIGSLMMLESCYRSFSSESIGPEQVEEALQAF
jgi:hypothetical protein